MKVGTISEEIIERIKQDNDIKEVALEYGIKIGHNNKGRCPFHKEGKTPNLHFYDNSYHCYTCKAGTKWQNKEKKIPHMLNLPDGTQIEDGGPSVIGLVMNLEKCNYVDACVILMERAGIPVPEAKIDYKAEKEKKRLTSMNKNFCKSLLGSKMMLKYLADRGINRDSIKKWRLGLVPVDHSHYLFGKRVQGRLVFGLTEESWNPKKARTIAMAYRAMTEAQEDDAKYLNDYNSTIYNKSTYLYGFNEARRAIRLAGYAIVMEGYVDVIIAHQSGMENSVATCGTSFPDEQMDKLRKLTNKIVMWYDGDGPGLENALAHVGRLMEKGFRVMMINSSPYDPAELMNRLKQDPAKIKEFIKMNARPAMDVMMDNVMDDYNEEVRPLQSKIDEAKLSALDELLPMLESIKDESERVIFKTKISERLGVVL